MPVGRGAGGVGQGLVCCHDGLGRRGESYGCQSSRRDGLVGGDRGAHLS
jgi:hypothetical protein